ncbi:MAG: extracellular solute-binding protein [Candidatus Tectomicrobia bacterium]|uniref:Extracellular solute-binding protein n=1 Tax=Tectimicrobiota bacterium TaxID=2528274 RepID=A0A932GRQ8_UNCTE|nr:extracellular solute-binding protein [Candidatus Tectomicrobia bacterium]
MRREQWSVVAGGLVTSLWVLVLTTGSWAASEALTRVLEGAKKEGVVDAVLPASLTPEGANKVEKGIAARYGVNLKINYAPTSNYPQLTAQAISEFRARVTPSYDIHVSSDSTIYGAVREGILEKVDWASLLPEGTPAEVVQFSGQSVAIYTGHVGLLYNPRVVSPQDVPNSLSDLGKPKWKGKFVIFPYTDLYTAYSLVYDKARILSDLKALMNNGAVVDTYPSAFRRFTVGEYPLILITSAFYEQAVKKGIPVRFKSLDFAYATIHQLGVRKGARHPNAAKLLIAYMSGPEAHRIWENEIGNGNSFYSDSYDHKLAQEAQKAGLKTFSWSHWPGAFEFQGTKAADDLRKEVSRILQGQ